MIFCPGAGVTVVVSLPAVSLPAAGGSSATTSVSFDGSGGTSVMFWPGAGVMITSGIPSAGSSAGGAV